MVVINTYADVETAPLDDSMKNYLYTYLQRLLQLYETDTLAEWGSIFILQSPADLESYQKMGLSQSLDENQLESLEWLHLGGRYVLQGTYIFNNDYAISIFIEEFVYHQMKEG